MTANMTVNSIAIAGGAVGVSLIDALIEQNVLSAEDGAYILMRAQDQLISHLENPDAARTAKIIGELFDRADAKRQKVQAQGSCR
jgi:hypothetical protein